MLDLVTDIAGQPANMLNNAAVLDEAYSELPGRLGNGDFVITGIATSLWAWHSGALVLQKSGITPFLVDASEYLRYGRPGMDKTPLLATSRSGESVEIVRLLEAIDSSRQLIGVTASEDSALAMRANVLLRFDADETAFFNTRSFTMTQCIAAAAAGGVSRRLDLDPRSWLAPLADQVDRFVGEVQTAYGDIAGMLAQSRVALLTSRGHLIGVAQQAALDLQEGTQIAALSTPGGLLRHGPIELTRLDDCITLLLIPHDHMAGVMLGLAEYLAEQGARVAVFANPGLNAPRGVPVVKVPTVTIELAPILFGVAFQNLMVALGRALGRTDIRPALVPKVTRVE